MGIYRMWWWVHTMRCNLFKRVARFEGIHGGLVRGGTGTVLYRYRGEAVDTLASEVFLYGLGLRFGIGSVCFGLDFSLSAG